MIRVTQVKTLQNPLVFPLSRHAKNWCRGQGVEFGAAAHNPFDLEAINVVPADDFEFYKQVQIEMCGSYAEVDVWAEAHETPFTDSQFDFVLTSHVIEHFADIVSAFEEWNRIVRHNGIIYMIIPVRDAREADAKRPIDTADTILKAYELRWTPDTVPPERAELAGDRRGHIWVLSPETIIDLVDRLGERGILNWELADKLERDDKVGNGFTLVYQVRKPSRRGRPKNAAKNVENQTGVSIQYATTAEGRQE